MNKADDKICAYNITQINSTDRPVVIEFFKEFFFRREPLIVCLKLWEDTESIKKLENYGFRALDNGLTYKAVSSNGELMGVILNEIMTRDDKEQNKSNDRDREDGSADFMKFMTLFEKTGQESDVFGKYPELNRVMDIKLVAVNEAFRGQGVCKALFDKTKELALENHCSMVHVECSSHFSASAAKKLGYQCIYSLSYKEYKNEKGEVIFNTSPPHEQFKVYVLPIKK